MDNFTIHVTRDGVITFPPGCKNIWDAQFKVEQRLIERHDRREHEELQRQLNPVPTITQVYFKTQAQDKAARLENICIARACCFFDSWPERITYLLENGYEYGGGTNQVVRHLMRRITELEKLEVWEKIIREVENTTNEYGNASDTEKA